MLTFQSNPDIVEQMQDAIHSGKFFSITFVKMDNTIRYVNGHRVVYSSDSTPEENRGKFNRFDKNILLVWDNNRINDMTGEKGQYISVKLERILFFKSGAMNIDFTQINPEVLQSAGITPDQITQIKTKMKLQETIYEVMDEFVNEKVIGKGIPATYYCIIWTKEGYRVDEYNDEKYIDVEWAVKDAVKYALEYKRGTYVELISRDENGNDLEYTKIFEIDYPRLMKAQQKINSIPQNQQQI